MTTRPETAAEGEALIRAKVIEIFDRQDGTGADWPLMLESLFRAGFKMIEQQPVERNGRLEKLLLRIHEGAYKYLTAAAAAAAAAGEGEGEGRSFHDSGLVTSGSQPTRPPGLDYKK